MSKKWQIKVPGSTANLGPGFDSIGLGLITLFNIRCHITRRVGIYAYW